MRNPRACEDPAQSKRNKEKSARALQSIAHPASDRLHLAMMVTLVAITIVAVVSSLTRSTVSSGNPGSTPVLVVSDGVSATLYSQAQIVASALTRRAAPTPTSEAPVISQSLDGVPAAGLVPRPLLAAAARILVQGALADPEGQQGLVMQVQEPVQFSLHVGGFAEDVFSTRSTVGGALAALDVDFNSYDHVMPLPETPLTAGMHVFVDRATVVGLKVGARHRTIVQTHVETVADLLTEQGVELSEGDRVRPKPSKPLRDDLEIVVTVVNEVIEYENTPIPFSTIYRDDPSLPAGTQVVVQVGVDGFVRHEYAVVYENDQEVSRELLSDSAVPPDHRVIAQGTAVVAAAVAAPDAPAPVAAPGGDPQCVRTLTVWATWYTAASAGGSGRTATGTEVHKGTVAVDPRVIPLGTHMHIPGYGYGVAEDTGGSIKGNIIDLGYGPNDVYDWSSRYVDICILN